MSTYAAELANARIFAIRILCQITLDTRNPAEQRRAAVAILNAPEALDDEEKNEDDLPPDAVPNDPESPPAAPGPSDSGTSEIPSPKSHIEGHPPYEPSAQAKDESPARAGILISPSVPESRDQRLPSPGG